MVTINEAIQIIQSKVAPIIQTKSIPIENSLGCIVAKDLKATINLPKFNNSAMDGYAINATDIGKTVVIQNGTIFAGTKNLPALQSNHAIRIMTGAPIPKNCDTVVPIELIEIENNQIHIPSIQKGANIRYKGEELQEGTICLARGESINAYTIALLASQGMDTVEVFESVQVSIIGSGNELKHFKQELLEYQIYNSNTPMLTHRARELHCKTDTIQSSSDDKLILQKTLEKALQHSNLIITTGGASVGDKDFTREVLSELGMVYLFEKVDIKPGKPTSLGVIGDVYILILPGNPTAAMINFELFGKLIIQKLQNKKFGLHKKIKTQMKDDFYLKSGKQSVILGYFDGFAFIPLLKQSPNYLSTLKDANSFIVTEKTTDTIVKNEDLEIFLL